MEKIDKLDKQILEIISQNARAWDIAPAHT